MKQLELKIIAAITGFYTVSFLYNSDLFEGISLLFLTVILFLLSFLPEKKDISDVKKKRPDVRYSSGKNYIITN